MKKIKILHLEDSSSDAFLIEKRLSKSRIPIELRLVETRDAYCLALKEFSPDVILADHSLPSFNSHEALDELQQRGLKIPFILITSAMSDEFAVDILKRGADDYILKDRLERLPNAVENCLDKKILERERQEFIDELIRKERRYFSLVENAADTILILDREACIQYASSSFQRVFGYTDKEASRIKLSDLVHPEDKTAAHQDMLECLEKRGEAVKSKIRRLKHANGSWRWIESTATNLLHDPAVGGIVENLKDITERIDAEQALIESERKYRAFFENSMDGILLTSPDGNVHAANPAACEIFGMDEEEICSSGREGIVDLNDPRLAKLLEHREQHGQVKSEITLLRKGGLPFPAEITSTLFADACGNIRSSMIIRDITEREAVLRKLKEKRTKLLAAQRIAKLGYWELNIENHSFYGTDEVYGIWGRDKTADSITLKGFIETIHPDERRLIEKKLLSSIKGRKNFEMEYRILLPNGGERWIHDIGSFKEATAISPPSFEGTAQDITERKLAIEQLALSEARHRALIQSQTNYLIRVDLEGKYSYCNEKFAQDFAWLFINNEVLGKETFSSILEYHHDRLRKTVEACLANPNKVFQVELDKPRKDGGIKTTLWDLICLLDEKDRPTEIQGSGIDISDRVLAERALKESNSRYELVAKATSDAIWDWDISRDEIYWGRGIASLFGHDSEKELSNIHSWSEHIHEADRKKVWDHLCAALGGSGDYWKAEYRLQRANGEYAYVVDRGYILRDENGKAIRMVGAMHDLTEKKKLEDLLSKAYDLAVIGSYEVNLTNRKVYWSEITKQIHEVDEDFVPDMENSFNFYQLGADRDSIIQAFKHAIEENRPFDEEIRITTAKGNERWVRAIGEAEFIGDQCIRVYGSFQDIHKLKQSELEISQMLQEKEGILESIGDAFLALEPNWTVTYWNKEAERLLNKPKELVLGRNLWKVFLEAIDTLFYEFYHKALSENEFQYFETFYEETASWLEANIYPSRTGLSVYLRDITERKEAEIQLRNLNRDLQEYTEELVSANKGLEQYSFIVSHNLRAPVANIIGLCDLLFTEGFSDDERNQFLLGLKENVKRLDSVIIDLNDILKVKRQISEKRETVYLESLVDDVQASIDDLIKREQVIIRTDFSQAPSLFTLKSYLHSIFYNLLSNSIKYRRLEITPVVEIKSERIGNSVILFFKDNGMGIDLSLRREQVFGLYKRFHLDIEGKGMGLFMVKTQVEMQGGKIEIESEVGKGTVFKIVLKNQSSENERGLEG